MTDNNSLYQNQEFLKILQHIMELLEGNSCNIEENIYLLLVNNLQRLYDIQNSSTRYKLINSYNSVNSDNSDNSDNNIIAKHSAYMSVVFFVIAFTCAIFSSPTTALTSTVFTLASAFITYLHC